MEQVIQYIEELIQLYGGPHRVVTLIALGIASTYSVVTWLRLGPQSNFMRRLFGIKENFPIKIVHLTPGYEKVLQQFERNFQEGLELGSSFVAYVDGKLVVELYGGWHDHKRTKQYDPNSLQLVFSSGKTVMAVLVAHLVDKGLIDLNKRVADYWPEFAQGGKDHVLVKDLLGHRGGVAWLDEAYKINSEELMDLDLVADKIAKQPHNHGGQALHEYNGVTRDWYVNEIVRRVDPSHRSAGQFWRQELNSKLGVEVYVGLPEEQYQRVSMLQDYPQYRTLIRALFPSFLHGQPFPFIMLKVRKQKSKGLFGKNFKVVGTTTDITKISKEANMYDYMKGEGPSYSTVTNASSLARLGLAMLVGTVDGFKFISDPATYKKVYEELEVQEDLAVGIPVPFTAGGFNLTRGVSIPDPDMLEQDKRGKYSALGERWYGWGGLGGSLVYWNPVSNIAIGYAENQLHVVLVCETRTERLVHAVYECYKAASKVK